MQTKPKAPLAGRTRVGPNLYRQVATSGTESWVLRFQLRGVKRWMGLGPVGIYSLREATTRAGAAQKLIYEGVDPIAARRAELASEAKKAILSVTFEVAAKAFFDQHQAKWGAKSRTAFLSTMATYAYPVIGSLPVDMVDTPLVLKVIEPIWLSKFVTAGRVRSRLEQVLAWATVRGFRTGDNPGRWKGHLDQLLPVGGAIGEVIHHPAMAYADVPRFVEELRQRQGVGAAALEFAILTASRTAEVLRAQWSEVDLEANVWVRPASHMKAGVEHAVPLTPRMVEILRALPRGSASDLIFVGKTGGPLGKNALPKLVAGAGITVHGFRSSFKDWASERTNHPRELAEHALAHTVGNAVENAYARSKLIEKRRRLMVEWERFIAGPAMGGDVIPIRSNSA